MCRGCRVFQCCCGCTDLKTGVLIWAIIDAIFVGIYTAYQIISLIGSVVSGGPSEIIIVLGVASVVWGITVVLADVGLAIGANKSNTLLMLVWLVVMMITIVVISGLIVVVPILVRFSRHFFFQLCNVLNAIFFCRFL